jgi:hypothetical protein
LGKTAGNFESMSDKYVGLNSFKYGLDARRDALSSVPGTLQTLVNAHINGGGEIEQRMSFVKDAVAYPSTTFGLQDTDTGLMTFGTVSSGAVGTLPTGVVYQQLVPPAGLGSTIAVLVFSCNYLGKAFVIVQFDNSDHTFAYYDGTLVGSTRNGLVLPGAGLGGAPETPTELAVDLAAQINAVAAAYGMTGMVAVANTDQFGVLTPGSVMVTLPVGVQGDFAPTYSSTAGILGSQPIDQGTDGTAGKSATASFAITGGGLGGKITLQAPFTISGTGTAVLCLDVLWDTDAATTAHNVAVAVRANAALFHYGAAANGTTVTIYAPLKFGNFTFPLTIITTAPLTVGAAGAPGVGLVATLNPTNIVNEVSVSYRTLYQAVLTGICTVQTSGNVGAVSYTWAEVNSAGDPAPGLSGITMKSTNQQSNTFTGALDARPGTDTKLGYFHCTVQDSVSVIVIPFYVKFTAKRI